MIKHAPYLALSALAACGGPDFSGEPLVIGTASEDAARFVPVEDGADLGLLPGSQGGFHIFVRVRMSSAAADAMGAEWLLKREARRVDTGTLVSRAEHRVTTRSGGLHMVPSGEPGIVETDRTMLLFLCPAPVGVDIYDEPLRLEVRAEPVDAEAGAEPFARGDLTFTPRCDDPEQRAFCERICSG